VRKSSLGNLRLGSINLQKKRGSKSGACHLSPPFFGNLHFEQLNYAPQTKILEESFFFANARRTVLMDPKSPPRLSHRGTQRFPFATSVSGCSSPCANLAQPHCTRLVPPRFSLPFQFNRKDRIRTCRSFSKAFSEGSHKDLAAAVGAVSPTFNMAK
jgi:hypothetical protein